MFSHIVRNRDYRIGGINSKTVSIMLDEKNKNVRERCASEKNLYITRYVIYGKLRKPEISLVAL